MNTFVKFAAAATMTGALALAMATPSEARNGRNAAAIGGFAAGAVVGAAVASSANNGYYADDYAYEPAYTDRSYSRTYYGGDATPYAYEPAPRYYYNGRNTSDRNCGGSPGKSNFTSCGSN
ncbi:MAG: hypothetical protein Q7T81_11050 [Pseudolabrys sp.]|nr:hypothetical protein [Pseudolabrys sp.]